jgi:hypothetical protein
MHRPHVEGRLDKDPSESSVDVPSDDYLNYAMSNRQGWEDCSLEVVARLVEETKAKLLLSWSSLRD